MGEEIWTPEEQEESLETRRAIRRGIEADESIPVVTGYPNTMNTRMGIKRATDVQDI